MFVIFYIKKDFRIELNYFMKRIILIISYLGWVVQGFGQVVSIRETSALQIPLPPVVKGAVCHAPTKVWDKRFGCGETDWLMTIVQNNSGDYFLGAVSYSGIAEDKTQVSQGGEDFWIVKMDANRNKVWDKRYGGDKDDRLTCMLTTDDGNIFLGGYSYSGISGDKTAASKGESDFWLIKIDANGNQLWDKTFGGAGSDGMNAIIKTIDGGYMLGGGSASGISGDKTQDSRGSGDYWVVKIDANGNKLWDRRFGGNRGEAIEKMIATTDGGYLLGSATYSGISGDKTQNVRGEYDCWLIKIDANGNKLWDKNLGGANQDYISGLLNTHDGGYMIGANSYSDLSPDKQPPVKEE